MAEQLKTDKPEGRLEAYIARAWLSITFCPVYHTSQHDVTIYLHESAYGLIELNKYCDSNRQNIQNNIFFYNFRILFFSVCYNK